MDALTEPRGMTDEHTVRESNAGEVRAGRGRSRIVIDRVVPPMYVTSRVNDFVKGPGQQAQPGHLLHQAVVAAHQGKTVADRKSVV